MVLVGNRQNGREIAENVIRVKAEKEAILEAVKKQLAHGHYPPSTLYGDGKVSQTIAEKLTTIEPYIQKRLAFAEGSHHAATSKAG